MTDAVRASLDRYGITDLVGVDAYYGHERDVVSVFSQHNSRPEQV